jgi:hypothetical protein
MAATPPPPRHLRQGRQLRRERVLPRRRQALYSGFDLCAPTTSVSMTINGPAPTVLAFYLNAADRRRPRAPPQEGGQVARGRGAIAAWFSSPRARAPDVSRRAADDTRRVGIGLPRPLRRSRRRQGALRRGQGRCAEEGARHRAGRHPQGGPGAEHLHLLDGVRPQDDGRHPAALRRPRTSRTSIRCRSAATTSPRPVRTPSPSSRSRSPTASPSSSTTSRAA